MSVTTFQPIQQHETFSSPPSDNSRPSSALSSTTDSSENETQSKPPQRGDHSNPTRSNHSHTRDTSCSPSILRKDNKFLLRRSSSAMRVRELRDVLSKMTDETNEEKEKEEMKVTGSQNARLLVASQQCLVSRLQDLRNELESMDNEVTRVRQDIVNSRRYFSAMTGIKCGPEWPAMRQTDSAYTSPINFYSRSTDISPYSSDNDSKTTATALSRSNFQKLQHFENVHNIRRPSMNGHLSRTDSCSSFLSWRSEAEMATLFPDEMSSPHSTPRTQSPCFETLTSVK